MKKKNIEIILLGLYAILFVTSFIFSNSILTLLSSSVAIFTFIFVQQTPGGKIDERDKLISQKAGMFSFQIMLVVLVALDLAHDFIDLTTFTSVDSLLTTLVGLGFITYASNHIYYKEIH
jgi:hypothetical protein